MNFGNSAVIKSCVKDFQVSFAQDPSKWKKTKTVGIWTGERSSCSVTKLYNYPKTNHAFNIEVKSA